MTTVIQKVVIYY